MLWPAWNVPSQWASQISEGMQKVPSAATGKREHLWMSEEKVFAPGAE